MGLKELKEKARKLGVKPKLGIKKEVLIRSIQAAEGNFPCFGAVKDYCIKNRDGVLFLRTQLQFKF